VARDGKIYFTDASYRFDLANIWGDALEHRPNGRLLSYDPKFARVTVVKDGLVYPRGLALSADQEHMYLVEGWHYRVLKWHLQKAEMEVFAENLPGFPLSIAVGLDEDCWVFVKPLRWDVLRSLAKLPLLRGMLAKLPLGRFGDESYVMSFDKLGRLRQHWRLGDSRLLHSMQEYRGNIYLGSLVETAIKRVKIGTVI
jgi:hypothetical protein